VEGVLPRAEIMLDDPLPRHAGHPLLDPLTPRVGARVVERAAVELVRREAAIHVIVAERDVVPRALRELRLRDLLRRRLAGRGVRTEHPLDLAVQQEDVPAMRAGGHELRPTVLVVGDREHGQVQLGEVERARFRIDDVHAQRDEQSEDASRLGGARRVVVPGDHDHFGARQRRAQARELEIRVEDGRVGRAHLMENVARDEHDVRRQLDHLVQRARERLRDVRLTLIDPTRSQPLILAVTEVEVGEVDEAQSRLGKGALTSCARGS
jgi:hypothetical protein